MRSAGVRRYPVSTSPDPTTLTFAFPPPARSPRPRRRVSLAAWRGGTRAARWSWFLLLALLLQQVAIVAYACNRTDVEPARPAAMAMAGMPDCEGMQTPPVPAACEKHCHPDPQTPGDARVPAVPPSAVPVAHFDLVRVLLPPEGERVGWLHPRLHATDPPPLKRFGALLI